MRKTLAAALLLTTSSLPAHHAFAAEYDENKLVTVTGFEWINPHAWLTVDGWGFEMGSPNGLLRRGWTRTDLKKGDHVTVIGYAAKDGTNKANARTITLPDGRKLFGGFQSTPGAPAK